LKGLFQIRNDEHGTLTNLINHAVYARHVRQPVCPICRCHITNNSIHEFK